MNDIEISDRLAPGALGRLIEMHALYYASEWRFGPFFEAKVAREAGEFVAALPREDSRLWHAVLDQRVVGTIAIDGRHAGASGAHLRWFILDDVSRGAGVGAKLLDTALAFCRTRGFAHVYLWTFAGLDAARRLYESRGFRLAHEQEAESWGMAVREQRFVLELAA